MTGVPNLYFSPQDHGYLKEKLFKLLEQKGVRMDHPVVIDALSGCGALVDRSTNTVRLPEPVMEKLIARTPEQILLAAGSSRFDLAIPHPENSFYVRTGTGARSYIDPEGGTYRPTRLNDISAWARLTGKLEHIDFCAFPSPLDAPEKTTDIHALRETIFNCPKHIWVQPYSTESLPYLFKMVEIAAGGKEALKKRPPASFITCSLSPLDFKYMDLEVVVQACARGIPLHACSLPSAGGTGPVTMAGTVLLAAAETLVLLASAQAVKPGSPVIATPLIFSLDMLSGRGLQSSAEAIQGAAAAVNFLKNSFNLPVHTYGFGTDSPDNDGQAQAERSLLALMTALAGSNILGGAGQVEAATTISPLQLIVDNDLAGMVKKMKAGVILDEEHLGWDDLLNLKPGGHFLGNEHTFKHCRQVFKPQTFVRRPRENRALESQADYMAKAKAVHDQIMAEAEEPIISENIREEINAIVREADLHLARDHR